MQMPEHPKLLDPQSRAPIGSTRTGLKVLRLLGIFSGGLGLYVGYCCISASFRYFNLADNSLFHLVPNALSGVFAIWCLASCYRSWKPDGAPPIRGLSTIIALCAGYFALGFLSQGGAVGGVQGSLRSFGIVLLICTVYVALSWWLASALSVPHSTRRIPQFVIVVVCWQLWIASSVVLNEVVPKEGNGKSDLPAGHWMLVDLLLPLVLALLLGRFLGWIGTKREAQRTSSAAALKTTEACR
jgi:hypothetical protein